MMQKHKLGNLEVSAMGLVCMSMGFLRFTEGFGLRFGETTVAEPQAERPPIIRHLKCRS